MSCTFSNLEQQGFNELFPDLEFLVEAHYIEPKGVSLEELIDHTEAEEQKKYIGELHEKIRNWYHHESIVH